MDRRTFLGTLTGGLLAAPLAAEAQLQPGRVYRIGILHVVPPEASLGFQAFRQRLRELGYDEGRNLVFEYRWPRERWDQLPALATELAHLGVDVIVTGAATTTVAAKHATSEIPIVMPVGADPVAAGFVTSLARPGGNVTGLSILAPELSRKRLELLRETVPGVSRIALLWDPRASHHPAMVREIEEAAQRLGVVIQRVEASGPDDIDRAFEVAVKERTGALLAVESAEFSRVRTRIAALALKHRLPTMIAADGFAEAGGFMQFGASATELWRRAAIYVDKILKGAKPADLPVEQPTKFELVINLKTAKALGLTIPSSLLQRADQVIE